MSWVARAFPAKSTSTYPASTSATIAGAAPVCTTAGPPTQSTFLPSALTSRICWAIWRTSRACGFSEDTSDFMNSKPPALRSIAGSGTTLTPLAPHTIWSPALHVADRDRARPVTGHDDPAVHLGVLDRHPVRCQPDDRLEVGRGVEVVGEHAVGLHLRSTTSPGSVRLTPWVCSRITMRAEVLVAVGLHGQPGVGLVDRRLADLELVDGVVAAVLEDVVEHPGQDPRVDQVAAYLDGLALTVAVLSTARLRRRPRRPARCPWADGPSCGRRA